MRIDKNSGKGYVALTAMCEGKNLIAISYTSTNFLQAEEGANGFIPIHCVGLYPIYFLVKLPAGNYNIDGFRSGHYVTDNINNISFKVLSGKVVYLGRFYIKAISEENSNKFLIVTFDRFNQDISNFLQMYKNIPKDSYINTTLSIGGGKLPDIAANTMNEQDIKNISHAPLTINYKTSQT